MAATKTKRKPADSQLRHGHLTHRDAIWSAIRKLQEFGISDIENLTRVNHGTIETYLLGLTRADYLERTAHQTRAQGDGKFQRSRWRLINDVGVDAPRVTRHGKRVTQGQARENMWRTMRIIGEFNARELAIQSSTEDVAVKASDAKDYVRHLHLAGYLKLTAESKPGNKPGTGTLARYRFIAACYTGPRPPMVQSVKQVFDPNLGKVMRPTNGGTGGNK